MRNLVTSSAVPLSLLTAVKVSDVKEISSGSNQQVINEARKNLPVLQTHLKLAEQTQSQLETSPVLG
ncbi:hypothetical protein HEP81_01665 [Streptomyces griseofuscus]|uniref:DUF4142 domain-containing protein n=1 Tax=Streptomyces griseofuscus TaxID=146922 RepID=A0A7H1PVB4_9ACTN|nr:hypothetical protein HEP81_01665 [Streptomyces griseofuscus]